jgi:hypothetical protein
MALSKQEIAAAQAMHRFVKTYERRFKSSRLGLYCALFTTPLTARHFLDHYLSSSTSSYIFLATFSCIWIGLFWFAFSTLRYNRERAILGILEREHRDELPWHHPPPLPNEQHPISVSRSGRPVAG